MNVANYERDRFTVPLLLVCVCRWTTECWTLWPLVVVGPVANAVS
jgi:hypothetical protein